MMSAPTIHAEILVDDLLDMRPSAAAVFIQYRMACVGCAFARFETLAEACANYGEPIENFLAALSREPEDPHE